MAIEITRRMLAVLAFGVLSCACTPATIATEPPELNVGELGKLKFEAEYWAKRIKPRYAKDSQEYREVENRYTTAAASVNAWILQVTANLQTNRPVTDSLTDGFRKEATEGTNRFVEYVNMLIGRGAIPIATIGSLVTIFKTLSDAVTGIEDKRRQWREADVKKAVDLLGTVKWQAFDSL